MIGTAGDWCVSLCLNGWEESLHKILRIKNKIINGNKIKVYKKVPILDASSISNVARVSVIYLVWR